MYTVPGVEIIADSGRHWCVSHTYWRTIDFGWIVTFCRMDVELFPVGHFCWQGDISLLLVEGMACHLHAGTYPLHTGASLLLAELDMTY